MNRLRVGVLLVALVTVVVGCGEEPPVSVTFEVDGMTCESCSSAITTALEQVDGVERASADHLGGTAEAVIRDGAVSTEDLVDEIEGLGYTVTDILRVGEGS